MLLDEKRTKRIVRIVAILTSLAFAGVGAIVIGIVILGNTPSATEQVVKDARSAIKASPNSAKAWGNLAAALQADGKTDEAVTSARKAVSLAPGDYEQTQVLTSVLVNAGRPGDAIEVLQTFTTKDPTEPEAFLQLGQLAQQQGRTALARLSYQAYLRLSPQGATADSVRAALKQINNPSTPAPTP